MSSGAEQGDGGSDSGWLVGFLAEVCKFICETRTVFYTHA